jgi:hypothetical protein
LIQGHVDIDFLTDKMLEAIKFTHTIDKDYRKNPLWLELQISMPDYPNDSLSLLQVYDDQCPSWAFKIKQQFDSWVFHSTLAISMLRPGKFTPPHRDTLFRLKETVSHANIDVSYLTPVRVNILLQDKHIGHFLDIDGDQMPNNYVRGDYVIIYPEVIHSCGNIGYTNRYTMQISGFIKK